MDRAATTYRYERFRAISSGMLETAGATFLLLIAVTQFKAGATAKALIAGGGSFGLLVSPLVVSFVEQRRIPTARAASRLALFGCLCMIVMAALPFLPIFVVGSVLTMAAATASVPLVTQIYQENYPENQRGKMFSKTVMIRIGTAALFSHFAGAFLNGHPENVRWFLLVLAAAFGAASYCIGKCPSNPLDHSGSSHPFKSLRYAKEDALFRSTLVAWMLMGFANLMMLPMRIEYLANPRYGISMTPMEVAFLTGVIPNVARLVMSPVWGVLFDRMNFFVLRVTLNCGFALGILAFFTSNDLKGLIVGALIYGISNAGGDVAWGLWVTKFAPPERVADYMSVHTFFTGVRGVIAPMVAFYMITHFKVQSLGIFSVVLILLASAWLIPDIKLGKKLRRATRLTEEISE